MAGRWPLYHFDAIVPCFKCGAPLGQARTGLVIDFGDGNGNRELACQCGHKTWFDATKSAEKAKADAKEYEPMMAARRKAMGEFEAAKQASRPPGNRRMVKAAPAPVGSGSAFDVPTDLGALITKEIKIQRAI